jgi:predicted phosphate transport protein (TIGR00153 family)
MMFIPKDQKFFDHFEELANTIEKGSQLFLDILNNFEHSEAKLSTLKELEHEADQVTHIIYAKLHKTFITPLDREDIHALANRMDSILDIIEGTAVRMYLYGMKKPGKEIVELALILNNAIEVVKRVIYGLRDMKNPKMIIDACVEIHTIENQGDYLLHQCIARLFQNEKDPFELIKMKEVYELVEEAIDTCEDVTNVVEGIVLKHG